MKKLLVILLAVAIASPAMADVALTITDNGDGTATVSYDASGEAELPRAFGLDITVDAGTVDDASAPVGAEPFRVYPGTINIPADGSMPTGADWGSPIAPVGDPGALDPAVDGGATVEMGSLYDVQNPDDANVPAADGVLLVVTPSELPCYMSITANTTRANTGVVMEDGSDGTLGLTGATDVLIDEPASTVCPGDGDGNGVVTLDDLVTAITIMDNNGFADIPSDHASYNAAFDWDQNGTWTLDDLVTFVTVMDNNGFADISCE